MVDGRRESASDENNRAEKRACKEDSGWEIYKKAPGPRSPPTQERFELTLRWLSQFDLGPNVLCLGHLTWLEEKIRGWNVELHFPSARDYDNGLELVSKEIFDSALMFDIIEHLMNPLLALREAREALKPGGRLFLSTPIARPERLWPVHHFNELSARRLVDLLEKAGFNILDFKEVRITPWRCCFYGIRPLLRVLFFNRHSLVMAERGNKSSHG